MIKIYKNTKEIDSIEKGCWINISNPTDEEIDKISTSAKIKKSVLKRALDPEEQSRTEITDSYKLIIVDMPSSEKHANYNISVTIPLVILHVRDDYIITMCIEETNVFDGFINNKTLELDTSLKSRFTFMILQGITENYIKELKSINEETNKAEKSLKKTTQNKQLVKLMHLQKSLVYFSVSLKGNEALIEKIAKNNLIPLFEEDNYLLDSVLIEIRQAIEMASIYSSILSSMVAAFGTIISNNLNIVMKFLAGFTIVISIPTMIASFMGMNVERAHEYLTGGITFYIIVLIALIFSIIAAIILKKKDML